MSEPKPRCYLIDVPGGKEEITARERISDRYERDERAIGGLREKYKPHSKPHMSKMTPGQWDKLIKLLTGIDARHIAEAHQEERRRPYYRPRNSR